MKTSIIIIINLLIMMSFQSCKSKEEKAEELIKTELSKTLYDFDSYEPIETKVSEAYETAINDSTCMTMAMLVAYGMEQCDEYLEKAKDAAEHMEIWGAPTYYSSTYSDRQYYKYRDELKEIKDKIDTSLEVVKKMGLALQDSVSNLDNNKIIGWEVNHRFRCKTKGGLSTIGDYRYIISKDFKSIIWNEDTEDERVSNAKNLIKSAENKEFSSDKEDGN